MIAILDGEDNNAIAINSDLVTHVEEVGYKISKVYFNTSGGSYQHNVRIKMSVEDIVNRLYGVQG